MDVKNFEFELPSRKQVKFRGRNAGGAALGPWIARNEKMATRETTRPGKAK